MKKKLNIIPNGRIILLIITIMGIITTMLSVFLVPKLESFILLFFTLIFVLSICYFVSMKYNDFIYFSENEVWHNLEKYEWENVYITMCFVKPTFVSSFARTSLDHYFHFSDHYLTENEIKSKRIKQKGFYLLMTPKRADFILSLYNKEVKIISKAPLYGKIVIKMVNDHNDKVKHNTSS